MKKYKLTEETIEHNGRTLHRIEALKTFRDVKVGDKGGWVESEDNLSHLGDCWIYGEAKAYNNSIVYENATIYQFAQIYSSAEVYGNAKVGGHARVYGASKIQGMSIIS